MLGGEKIWKKVGNVKNVCGNFRLYRLANVKKNKTKRFQGSKVSSEKEIRIKNNDKILLK